MYNVRPVHKAMWEKCIFIDLMWLEVQMMCSLVLE